MENIPQTQKRILIVDDNESIHEDIHNILDTKPKRHKDSETKQLEAELFGGDPSSKDVEDNSSPNYIIDDAYQGAEAIKMVKQAAEEGFPYAMIFMDVRMPPGMDGIQAITEIWKDHPQIEMVICTAYSDYSWDQIVDQFGSTEHLLFMKKPFDSISLKQTALSLTTKWDQANKKAQYVEKLKTEINNRTHQLSEMMEHLKKIKKESETLTLAKNKFFNSITSELQTPLNGILGVTDLLLDTELNEEQRTFAETIKLSGNSLLLIVNDILDFSKTEEPLTDVQEIVFDLRTTLDSIIDLIAVAANEKEIEITCFVDCHVNQLFIGDPFKLRKVLLLSLTHIVQTEECCEIVIAVSSEVDKREESAILLFEISKLSKITDEFNQKKRLFKSRAENVVANLSEGDKFPRQEHIEELVAALGGNLQIRTDTKSGTQFTFTVKFGIGGPVFPSIDLSSTIIGMRCLVVSDYSISRKVLSLHINHWGGICKVATHKDNIVEKINLAKESNLPYDAVIVDLKNEPLEFYETLSQQIVENSKKHSINPPKLICLTAKAKRGDAQKIEQYGFSVYLTKPIKQSQLFKSLILVKSLKDENQFLNPNTLITKHFVDEFTPDYFKVLVAHENPSKLKMIITCLARLKVRCDVADDKKDLPAVMDLNQYDLLLIDCEKCDKEDYTFLNSIKSNYHGLKTVVLIDEEDNEVKEAIKTSAIDDFIYKPITNESLIATLQKNLSD